MDIKRLLRGEWKAILSDNRVEKSYINAGAAFGDALSYSGMGSIVGFDEMLDSWARWEKEYVQRGYKTISVDAFINFGGYGVSIDHLVGQKRTENESPRFHADIYKKRYPKSPTPVIDLDKMIQDGQPQSGTCEIPSTEE